MKKNGVLIVSLIVMMLILVSLIFSYIYYKNLTKGTPLTYHYIQALTMERPEIVETPDKDMVEKVDQLDAPEEVISEQEMSDEDKELLRYITGQHKVKPGESFSLITGQYWEDIYLWPDLYVRNDMRSDDPDLIFPEEVIDIYNRLGTDGEFSEREREEVLNTYLEVYRTFKSLGSRKDASARALLYTATKYDKDFLERFSSQIDPEDRRMVERYIAEAGYLE